MTWIATASLAGILATFVMDLWAAIAKHLLHLPTAHWDLVGRWFGHVARGTFVHRPFAQSAPIRNELLLGWLGHYLIGLFYGIAYLMIMDCLLEAQPSLPTAVMFGLATLVAPWCIMQPAMGAGFFASKTPKPGLVRLVNLSMHGVFGLSLYPALLLARWAMG